MELKKKAFLKSDRMGMGEQLRQSLTSLTVDVWGLERQTALSLKQHFAKATAQLNMPDEPFTLRIGNGNTLSIRIYCNNDTHFPIEVSELFRLLNVPVINSTSLEKFVNRMKQFFTAYGEIYEAANLQLSFKPADEKVLIQLLDKEEILATISFQELLKQFSLW